jgi:ketosteroid isomerase-like protein
MKKTILLLILIGGCMKEIDIQKESEVLLNTDKEFAQASLNKGAAEAFNMFLADDALQMPQGGEPVKGRTNIYNDMLQSEGKSKLQWEPQFAEVAGSGDMGWTWGIYKVLDINNEIVLSNGKYVNVWKKQDDGAWKVVIDIGNKSPDPVK